MNGQNYSPPKAKRIRLDLDLDCKESSHVEGVEDLEQEEAAAQDLDLSQYGIDDQSFRDFLEDVQAADNPEGQAAASVLENATVSCGSAVGFTMNKQVLKNIFGRLGLVELYTSTRLVCKLWNRVITAKHFIKWKKMYYKTKYHLKQPPSVKYTHNSPLLFDVARFVNKKFSKIQKPLKPVLQKHPQYVCVSRLARLAEQLQNEGTVHVPVFSDLEELVLLVACCRSVHQLIDLVHLLTRPMGGGFSSPALSYSEISEILYCLATIFRQGTAESPRTHYYLYYVLDVLERRAAVHVELDEPDGVTASAAKLTNEQLRIVNHKFEPGHTVKVIALAGTGKTTTLYQITCSNPHLNFLYCVFNKSVQKHAEKSVFAGCKNVKARTFHSLAYAYTEQKFGNTVPDLQPFHISKHIQSKHYRGHKKLSLAKCVKDTLDNYFASADQKIGLQHVLCDNDSDCFPQSTVLNEAKRYWKSMKSQDEIEIKITHDGYLKLCQLQKPRSLFAEHCDVLLVDEAQDLSPAIVDILSRQKTDKVFVGDPNQQIYSFRGAINALDQIIATHTYSLTRSFRFGPEISYACELALSHFKPEKTQILIGTTEIGSIDGSMRTGQEAIICRLNSTLVDEVVRTVTAKPEARIGFVGTTRVEDLDSSYGFKIIEEIAALKEGKTKKYMGCETLTDLITKAKKSGDKSLLGKIKIVERHGSKIPTLIERIKKRFVKENADVMFSTAHKSKGLEFETVIIADDFTAAHNENEMSEVDEDEKNLVYVAMSRAKKNLILSPSIWKTIFEDKFLFPTASTNQKISCSNCGRESVFLLEQVPFCLSGGERTPQAHFCSD